MLKRIHHHLHRHYHKKYHGKYTHAKQLFIFDIFLLVLAVAIFISGVVFLTRQPVVKDEVEIALTTNVGTLHSGSQVKLTFAITNTGKKIIHPSTLALRLPAGFIIDRSSTPETILNKENTVTLTTPLAPGATSEVTISGAWWAQPRKPEILFATLAYHEEGNPNLDQKIISFEPRFTGSIIEAHLTIATTTFPNQALPFRYTLKNTSPQPVSELAVTPDWDGRVTASTTLQDITLAPGEAISIMGEITAPSKADSYPFTLALNKIIRDRSLEQASLTERITVVYPAIVSTVELTDPLPYLEKKQTFPVQVSWHNDSTFTLSNQRLRLHFEPRGIIDVAATALQNGIGRDGNDLIISSAHKTALASGTPGAHDTFTLQFLTLPTLNLTGERINLEIIPSMEAETVLVQEQRFTREGKKLTLPVATDVTLTRNEVRYYTPEGDQIGRGPLPPKVGNTTKYWILLQASNTTNDLKDAALKIQLAPGVRFNSTSQSVTLGSELTYDQETNTVSWKHVSVPAQSKIGWNFMVEVTPTAEQVDKTIPLIDSGVFTAIDDVVGKKFAMTIPGMNNVLKANDKGSRVGARVRR